MRLQCTRLPDCRTIAGRARGNLILIKIKWGKSVKLILFSDYIIFIIHDLKLAYINVSSGQIKFVLNLTLKVTFPDIDKQ